MAKPPHSHPDIYTLLDLGLPSRLAGISKYTCELREVVQRKVSKEGGTRKESHLTHLFLLLPDGNLLET